MTVTAQSVLDGSRRALARALTAVEGCARRCVGPDTRGAVGAIVEMARLMRARCTTAFTIDGPKGPRYIAKMGAVLLAKKTGHPIVPVTMEAWRRGSRSRSTTTR